MRTTRLGLVLAALMWVVAGSIESLAAGPPRAWVTLTNCEYVANNANDGDSFHVRCDTNAFIVRLYFIDAPETGLTYPERTHEQSVYFGVSLDESMKAGVKSKDVVRDLLRKPFTVITRWASAGGRSTVPRFYSFVEVGGTNLAEILVAQGLARTKGVTVNLPSGEKSKAFSEKLQRLESNARLQKLGVWANSTGAVKPDKDQ
jgi:endonuclease YncB( thermonuclease family)